jgi:Holliday junction DNA helicase RuvA
MLAYISGKIIAKQGGELIILNQGLGYKVSVSSDIYNEATQDSEIELYTHQHVREDSLDLYGFKNLDDLEMFEMLLSVSGIGPKSALAVLSLSSTNHLKEAIVSEDAAMLTKVSGVGKKTAQRVVLELKEKIAKLGDFNNDTQTAVSSSDEIDALIALGYNMNEAREALRKVDKSISDSGERVKQALKNI